jgi:hypothetical protein
LFEIYCKGRISSVIKQFCSPVAINVASNTNQYRIN